MVWGVFQGEICFGKTPVNPLGLFPRGLSLEHHWRSILRIHIFYWNNNLLFSAIGLPPSMILPCRPNVCSLCNFSKTPFPEWQPILLPNWLISIQLTWGITISKGSLRRVSEKQFMVSYYLPTYIFFTNVVKDFTKDSPSCFAIYFDCSWVTCSNFCGLFLIIQTSTFMKK